MATTGFGCKKQKPTTITMNASYKQTQRIVLFFLITITSIANIFAADSTKTLKSFKNPLEFKFGRYAFAFFPVASVDPASGIELGVMPVLSVSPKNDSGLVFYRASSVTNHITYSTKNWANIRSDGQFFSSNGNCYKLFVQYLNAPDYFYGIGNDSINKNPSKYQNQYIKTIGELSKGFQEIYFVGIKIEYLYQNISDVEGSYLDSNIYGYKGGSFFNFGPVFRIDNRDNVNYPTKGWYAEIASTFQISKKSMNQNARFYNIDVRKYFTIAKTFHVAFQTNIASSSGEIPFYKLPTLGGKYNLRGISNKFMYVDKNVWYTQAETRKMLYKRIGIVAFAGVGNTFAVWNNSIFEQVKPIFGFGGRFQLIPRDKLNLRFDYAFGPNQDRGFYATVRESF